MESSDESVIDERLNPRRAMAVRRGKRGSHRVQAERQRVAQAIGNVRTKPIMRRPRTGYPPLSAYIRHFDFLHSFRPGGVRGAQFGIAISARAPQMRDGGRDIIIRMSASHQGSQVMSAAGEQAGEQLAFGRLLFV